MPTTIDGKKVKDANDVLYFFGKQKVIDILDTAQEVPIDNIVDMYDIPDFDIETAEGFYSSFTDMNSYIYKYILGTLLILTGRNGNGKTVFLNQEFIAEPLNQGLDVFIYSGEMGKPILKNWIEFALAGRENITLKENTVHKINPTILKPMREWYRGRVFAYDNDKDATTDTILKTLESVVRKNGVKVAVLDNLLTMDIETAQESEVWQEQKKFIAKLVNFAAKYNIFIVLVTHPRKTQEFRRLTSDDIGGTGAITNLSHYVLGIHRYTVKEKKGEKDGKGNYKSGCEPKEHDCVIDLFKNRITGHANKEIELYFDYPSYRFYSKPEELWKRYKWDKKTGDIPTHDPNKHDAKPDWINN